MRDGTTSGDGRAIRLRCLASRRTTCRTTGVAVAIA